MILSYLIAMIPIIIGGILWIKKKEIVWYEWAISSCVGLLTVVIFNAIIISGMTNDYETWSGELTSTVYYPRWVERYTVEVSDGTDSKGRSKSHTEYRHTTHQEHWICYDTLGESHEISQLKFNFFCKQFGPILPQYSFKSGFYSGDHNIYVCKNILGSFRPTTAWRKFENKIIACPSVFSYSKVPDSIKVFDYPKNNNFETSDRLIGLAKEKVSLYEWDCLNSELGPTKKVNLILVGFDSPDSNLGHYQESKWIGGKKNDLVLCYGEGWSYVFGWTESNLVKRNLETILLDNSIETKIIPLIKAEVKQNYVLKDWSRFDYLTIEPPNWSYFVLVLIIGLTQTGVWYWSFINDAGKQSKIKHGDFNRYKY